MKKPLMWIQVLLIGCMLVFLWVQYTVLQMSSEVIQCTPNAGML